ncbi:MULTISPECIES: tetratricopeptide repeat protein [Marinobacter]|jgi:Tfp pilus assembly protein PilF|uniref:Uncharacterized protein n=1 Tax=Marinobacter nauticus TaxID=2743 RepID=A0A3B8W8K4_MARNT|nr:tetratricopeptide repeat protein [Marinobacter nauticus]HAC26271.1 hypothetical protein [Marinobacter nauticus]
MKGIRSAGALIILTCLSALTQAATAVEMARQAYFLIERDPLDLDQRDEASYLIQRANVLDGDEPWVAVAQSRLTLVSGYKVGQRHDRRAYEESAVSTARQQAERAVRNGPNLAMAHVQLAMVLIIQGELRTAWDHLNTADSLNEQSFYPWYLRTVIAIHHKDEKFAAEGFKEIESRASQKYQKRLLLHERMRLAKATKNLEERDRLHRKMIELDPDYAYAWGNYGSFLLGQKRYREAVHNLERAVELKPYGLAVSQLAEARRKLNQAF